MPVNKAPRGRPVEEWTRGSGAGFRHARENSLLHRLSSSPRYLVSGRCTSTVPATTRVSNVSWCAVAGPRTTSPEISENVLPRHGRSTHGSSPAAWQRPPGPLNERGRVTARGDVGRRVHDADRQLAIVQPRPVCISGDRRGRRGGSPHADGPTGGPGRAWHQVEECRRHPRPDGHLHGDRKQRTPDPHAAQRVAQPLRPFAARRTGRTARYFVSRCFSSL